MLAVGIDIGGTFTDVVLLDFTSGYATTAKVLSTPTDLVRGVREGLEVALQEVGRPLAAVRSILHGTTVVTNAIIERRGEPTGLLTNTGFRDVLEMATEIRYDVFDLELRRSEPIVPRRRRLGVKGRIGADGAEIEPIDREDVRRAVAELRAAGTASIAVSLLHAYINGSHERTVRDVVVEVCGPDFPVTLSHEIAPEIGEYERTSTACANAYVMPLAGSYLKRLAEELQGAGAVPDPYIMTSNGGFVDIPEASRRPVRLIESGPAGGAIAASYIADLLDIDRVLSFDMGGTTAKLCFLEDRQPRMAYSFEAARLERFRTGSGLPLSIPVIEMIEIGAGGGSIARQDAMGLLAVGPRSAGAAPGPACYGLGGIYPTVTDADVAAGIIGSDALLGGHLALDEAVAREVIADLATQLSLPPERLAEGILEQVVESMAQAARLHAAEANIDLRSFDMVAFGGAGPVHAYFLARRLGVRRVVFPAGAGVLSAYGFVVADSRADVSRSSPGLLERLDWAQQRETLEALRSEADRKLRRLGLPAAEVKLSLVADLRVQGQGYVLHVPVDYKHAIDRNLAELHAAFAGAYRASYGVDASHDAVELVSWRLTLRGANPSRGDEHVWSAASGPTHRATDRTRAVRLPALGIDGEVPVLQRSAVAVDAVISGPVLIEDTNTSIVVGGDASVTRRPSGDLIMTIVDEPC